MIKWNMYNDTCYSENIATKSIKEVSMEALNKKAKLINFNLISNCLNKRLKYKCKPCLFALFSIAYKISCQCIYI